MNTVFSRFFLVSLTSIAIVTFALRLYHLRAPIADWHSWRQADTAAVARNFLRFGIDPLHPRYDDLSNIQSGKDNPMGWRMVEFPLYQALGAFIAHTVVQVPLEAWLRILTILASVGTAVIIGLIVSRHIDQMTGLLAALVFAVLPYSVFYGRTILPDPHAVFWAVLSLWLVGREKGWKWTVAGALAGGIALLTKPMAAFLLIPIPYMLYRQTDIRLPARHRFTQALAGVFVYSFICLFPLLLWRRWILQFPEGIAVSSWLFNGNGIRLKGAWFHWLFAERLANLILGYWGMIPLGIGLAMTPARKEGWLFRWWAIGVISYLLVFATGNVQHDYYQILTIPVIAIYVAKGLSVLIRGTNLIGRLEGRVMAGIAVTAMLAFSWYTIRTYYWINRPEIVEAGIAADTILPKSAKVIAPYGGDTAFLYQTHRQGWPIGFDIDQKIKMGATHYVTVSPKDDEPEIRELAQKYTILVRNDRYAIIDLTKPK